MTRTTFFKCHVVIQTSAWSLSSFLPSGQNHLLLCWSIGCCQGRTSTCSFGGSPAGWLTKRIHLTPEVHVQISIFSDPWNVLNILWILFNFVLFQTNHGVFLPFSWHNLFSPKDHLDWPPCRWWHLDPGRPHLPNDVSRWYQHLWSQGNSTWGVFSNRWSFNHECVSL